MRLLARYAVAYLTLLAGPLAVLLYAMRRRPESMARAHHVLVPPIWHDALRDRLEEQEHRTAEWLDRCAAIDRELRRTDVPTIAIPRRSS